MFAGSSWLLSECSHAVPICFYDLLWLPRLTPCVDATFPSKDISVNRNPLIPYSFILTLIASAKILSKAMFMVYEWA